jgi:thymidylate synthase ThyX
MSISAKIIEDTCIPGSRMTTFVLTLPRSILAELNTHRMFSRNAASSRAVPNEKLIRKIEDNPFVPKFAKNQKGMQSAELLEGDELVYAEHLWNQACCDAISLVDRFNQELDVHKQFTNRLLEPWMYCEVVLSGTDFANFFYQRNHPAAEPSFGALAYAMFEAYENSVPRELKRTCSVLDSSIEFWHLPMVDFEAWTAAERLDYEEILDYLSQRLNIEKTCMASIYTEERWVSRLLQDVSAGRVTKVSYFNLDTQKVDVLNDIRLAVQMSMNTPGHWSPFEHIARPAQVKEMTYSLEQLEVVSEPTNGGWHESKIRPIDGCLGYCGNLRGYTQYRKEFANENFRGF